MTLAIVSAVLLVVFLIQCLVGKLYDIFVVPHQISDSRDVKWLAENIVIITSCVAGIIAVAIWGGRIEFVVAIIYFGGILKEYAIDFFKERSYALRVAKETLRYWNRPSMWS